MKAVTISCFGGPEVMQFGDVPPPAPHAGEALVELELAGVNFTDVYQRSGFYARSHTYRTPLPMTLGSEGAGVVVAPDTAPRPRQRKSGDVFWSEAETHKVENTGKTNSRVMIIELKTPAKAKT